MGRGIRLQETEKPQLTLFVDTSVWSLALRRDSPSGQPEVAALARALDEEVTLLSTGLVLQEILQGFSGPKDRGPILDHFRSLPLLVPGREDHVAAADLRNGCRRAGIQVGTIDALLAQLCIRHRAMMLTTDTDFEHIAARYPLRLWRGPG
jgi:predicted nucleic acid-binding protein